MKTKNLLSLLLLLASLSLQAQTPNTISYQGELGDSQGMTVEDGDYTMFFALYDDSNSGNELWSEEQLVQVSNGLFSILLGSNNNLDLSFDRPYWLEITIDGETLSPRTALTASPYSMGGVATSLNLQDGSGIEVKDNNGNINYSVDPDGSSLQKGLAQYEGGIGIPLTESDSTIYIKAFDDLFYMGTDSSFTNKSNKGLREIIRWGGGQLFAILGNLIVDADQDVVDNVLGRNRIAVEANSSRNHAVKATSKNAEAVWARSTDNKGVYGESTHSIGVEGRSINNIGVKGISIDKDAVLGTSELGIGVHGVSNETSGVRGESINGTGTAGFSETWKGAWGESTSNDGVYGKSDSGYGVNGISSTNNGVRGISSSAAGVKGESSAGVGVHGVAASQQGVLGESTNSDGVKGTSNTGAGVSGFSTLNFGVFGESATLAGVRGTSFANIGVWGTSTSGSLAGVQGDNTEGPGVYGLSQSNTGVRGSSQSASGAYGSSVSGYGVRGESTSNAGVRGSSGTNVGVWGISSAQPGVFGESTSGEGTRGNSTSGVGARGLSNTNYGVLGESTTNAGVRGSSSTSVGVWGTALESIGVLGESTGANGVEGRSQSSIGVSGFSQSAPGVKGKSVSGAGVVGESDINHGVIGTAAGSGNGVLGRTNSPAFAAVRGENSEGPGIYAYSASNIGLISLGSTAAAEFKGDALITNSGKLQIDNVPDETTDNLLVWGTDKFVKKRSLADLFDEVDLTDLAVEDLCVNNSLVVKDDNGNTILSVLPDADPISEYFFNATGNVMINGALEALFKNFLIDHPLDPENKVLRHFSIESDELKNSYDGNVSLDKNGEAVVNLPDWFEALNRDFRYQLTCVGGFANVYIAEKVEDNSFKIAGGYEGLEVSWQVTGVRHDKQAMEHLPPIEEYKK